MTTSDRADPYSGPITPGLGAQIIEILRKRDGQRTDVEMISGERFSVFNIAWGRDFGEDWEHVSTNISPSVRGESFDFFFTSEVARLVDPESQHVLWERKFGDAADSA